jgi:hypothetical protein
VRPPKVSKSRSVSNRPPLRIRMSQFSAAGLSVRTCVMRACHGLLTHSPNVFGRSVLIHWASCVRSTRPMHPANMNAWPLQCSHSLGPKPENFLEYCTNLSPI